MIDLFGIGTLREKQNKYFFLKRFFCLSFYFSRCCFEKSSSWFDRLTLRPKIGLSVFCWFFFLSFLLLLLLCDLFKSIRWRKMQVAVFTLDLLSHTALVKWLLTIPVKAFILFQLIQSPKVWVLKHILKCFDFVI